MEENGRRRNPSRKASRALRSLDTNTFINKHPKSLCEDILADESQEQKNETSAIAWANDKNSNDNSRKENISQNVSAEKDIATVERAVTSTVETVTPPTSEHAVSATEKTIEEDEEALFTSKYPSKHPPKVVTFEMLKYYKHKPEYLDRNLLLEIIELLGKPAFEILLKDGKAISMEEFYKDNKISRTAQEAYSTGQTRITIPRVPREKNEMNKDRSRVGVYLMKFTDAKGNTFGIKVGVNGDGMREGDYDQESQQFEYVEIVSFHDASEEAEAELLQVYIQYLQRMVKKADCPSDLRILYKLALEGGMSCSLLRKPIMLAVESYVSFEFGVEGHLNCNPHEMIVGKEDIVREQQRVHDKVSASITCDINQATGNCKKNIVAALRTWKTDEKCLSNNGNNYRSVQVDVMNYIVDKTPINKEDVKDVLSSHPRTKLVEGDAYDTNYSPSETQEGLDIVTQVQQVIADTEGGIGVMYFHFVVTKHTKYYNLVDFLIECHEWEVWRVYTSQNGAKVYILHKNESVILLFNSSCRALDPNLPDDLQEDILNFVEVLRSVLGSLNWKNEVGEIATNHEYGYLIPLVSQRLKLMGIGPYYRSKLVHKLFVPDEIQPVYLHDYNNLPRTEYVTTNPTKGWEMAFYYKDNKVLSLFIRFKGLRNYIEKRLKKRNLKANLNQIARSEEEFKSIMTTLIQMLISIYIAKNDPEKRNILKAVFRHLYEQFRDSKGGFNVGKDWKSTEIELYIKGFKHRYGNVLSTCIPTESNFDHVAIRAWIPTRGGNSCRTFNKNIMKYVKDKNGFTFEMYLVELQKRLKTVCKWEEYSGHYLVDRNARFKDFETNKRVVQMFVDKVEIYNDLDQRDQFIEDFISDLEHEEIKVYNYDHENVSFHLETDLIMFCTKKFKDWRWRYC